MNDAEVRIRVTPTGIFESFALTLTAHNDQRCAVGTWREAASFP
jgi:hypothetical protein